MSRITIKDIAKQVGVNPSTISRALRDQADVSTQLKESIKRIADKLGYKPNFAAINLRKGKNSTIALIIPEISNYYFPSLIKGIEDVTHEKKYNLLILQSNDSLEREIQNADICANLGVEGILVSLTKESKDIEHFLELVYAGIQVVFFDKIIHETVCYKIGINDSLAAFDAITNVCKKNLNIKNVAGIFGDERLSITRDRLTGFNDAVKHLNLAVNSNGVFFSNNSLEARFAMENLWQKKNKPDLIFAMSDEVLEGVLQFVNEHKIKVPDDLILVAMSDGFLPKLSPFDISYMKTSGFNMGKSATNLLFDLIDKKQNEEKLYITETQFFNNWREDNNE